MLLPVFHRTRQERYRGYGKDANGNITIRGQILDRESVRLITPNRIEMSNDDSKITADAQILLCVEKFGGSE